MSTRPFSLGVTLHSFTQEYTSHVWGFEDLMRAAALCGGGVEIVGPAHHRGFPYVTDDFEATFKASVERNGLTPTSYGSYADPFMLPDRDLRPDEIVEYTIPQLQGARRLGFPIVRLQHFTAEVIDRLLPWADRLDLRLGWELHVPMTLESPRTQYLLSLVQKYDTPRLGLIPDAGIFARSISARHLAEGRARGIAPELVDTAVRAWHEGLDLDAALHAVGDPSGAAPVRTWVGEVWDTFGHSDPADLHEILPYVPHVHGKFFHLVDGDEPDLRYAELVRALVDGGYDGWVSSEYEGDAPDSLAIVQEHQAMIRRYVDAARTA
ncbi:MAG TPA: TIM barrel protein [Cellulomonas sp.]